MLKLTKTGIGLLTRQYRSVLKKCWAINVGLFTLGAIAAMIPTETEAAGCSELTSSSTLVDVINCLVSTSPGLGNNTQAIGNYATAVGADAEATGLVSTVLGNLAQASQTASLAVGYYAAALGDSSISLGRGAVTSNDNSTALGQFAESRGSSSVALGAYSVAGEDDVISVGHKTGDLNKWYDHYTGNLFRKIINVAEGSDANDAVAMSQLGNITIGTKILNPNGTSAISFGTNTGQITVGTAIARIANELDNNYYRKNKKSGILNGVKEGKIGNENDDNFSKSVQNIKAVNDNFATTTFLRAI